MNHDTKKAKTQEMHLSHCAATMIFWQASQESPLHPAGPKHMQSQAHFSVRTGGEGMGSEK